MKMNELNGRQRLLVVLSVLWTIAVLYLIFNSLPSFDPDIIAEIRSPESERLREYPKGNKARKYLNPYYGSQICPNFSRFLYYNETVQIKSVSQYIAFIRRQQMYMVLKFVGVWVSGISLGWAIDWIIKGFKKKIT